jgi:outer membrane protein OmpA-like peptidoglycan-associated protein
LEDLCCSFGTRIQIFNMHKKEKVIPPKPAPAPPAPEPVEPVIVEKVPDPIVEININEDKSEFKLETGNEILATVPVVNAVFFATNSSEIPAYYQSDDTGIDYFSINPVEAHKYILPRIAKILKNNPDAEITLVSSVSIDEIEQGIELSKKRADLVKNKLKELGIKQNIRTEARIVPQFPSSKEFEQGRIENQRVTININNAQLQEYVDIQNFAEVVGNISFDTKIENTDNNLNITSNMTDEDIISNSTGSYSLNARKRISNEAELPAIITYNSDEFSGADTTYLNINELEKEIIELKLNNFEAILRFNYDSSELSYENRLLLQQLVNKLPEGTTIEILGSADELGSAQRNKQLELERAANTEKFIKNNTNKNISIITGTNDKKFDESTPQGRFLNRSIIIRVK